MKVCSHSSGSNEEGDELTRERLIMEDGFTLLEVIVAIMIITTLVATFAPLIISSVEKIKWAGKRTEELYSKRSSMEKEMALLLGESTKVTIKGPTADGANSEWKVTGTQILVQGNDSNNNRERFFVSFVIPKE